MAKNIQRFQGKIALVTGASRGIGASVAILLASQGAQVILLARNQRLLEKTDDQIKKVGKTAILLPFDLMEIEKINMIGQAIYERFGRLDILVSNAAILGTLTQLVQITPEEWERVLKINFTSNWYLIRALDPLLRLSAAGRAVFVTSGVTRRIPAYWGTYAISKTALEMLVRIYAAETAMTNVKINLLSPGAVKTDMRKQAFPGEDTKKLKNPDDIAHAFLDLLDQDCTLHGKTIDLSLFNPANKESIRIYD